MTRPNILIVISLLGRCLKIFQMIGRALIVGQGK